MQGVRGVVPAGSGLLADTVGARIPAVIVLCIEVDIPIDIETVEVQVLDDFLADIEAEEQLVAADTPGSWRFREVSENR